MRETILGCLVALCAVGCDARSIELVNTDDPQSSSLGVVTAPLAPGASGPEVSALEGYLTQLGYFENQDLRQRYPLWRPIVSGEPEPGLYDAVLEAAVTAYQRLNALPQTGVVDADTLASMKAPRCGNPDVDLAAYDESEKYVLNKESWPTTTTNIGYGFIGTWTSSQKLAVRAGLAHWANVTNLTFTENTSNPSAAPMRFSFGPATCSSDAVACTGVSSTSGGTAIYDVSTVFSNLRTWTQVELQHTATHESGHGLGLSHSTVPGAIMWPSLTTDLPLATDDLIAISLKYSPWQWLPGAGRELAIAPDGVVYKLGTVTHPGGWELDRWSESVQTWSTISTTFGATQLAMGPGDLIIFSKNDNTVWSWGDDLSQYPNPPAPVFDLAYGNGITWALAGSLRACGAHTYRIGPGLSTWVDTGGCGSVIAADGAGRAWTVWNDGTVTRYDGAGNAASDWVVQSPAGSAVRIGISAVPGDFGLGVWTTSYTTSTTSQPVRAWDDQAKTWRTPRYGLNGGPIAVAPGGQPWIIDWQTTAIARQRRD